MSVRRGKVNGNSVWNGRAARSSDGWNQNVELAWVRNIVIHHEFFSGGDGNTLGGPDRCRRRAAGTRGSGADPRNHRDSPVSRLASGASGRQATSTQTMQKAGEEYRCLGKLLGLNAIEQDLLLLALVSATSFDLRDVLDEVGPLSRRGVTRLTAMALGDRSLNSCAPCRRKDWPPVACCPGSHSRALFLPGDRFGDAHRSARF